MIQRRNPSGVRISGDNYQFLVAWIEALASLATETHLTSLELEAAVPTGLDDIVVQLNSGAHRHIQAKYAVDQATPLNTEWLLRTDKPTAKSLLQKLYDGWLRLGASTAITVELVTNRAVDPNDPILATIDARNDSLRRLTNNPAPGGAIGRGLDEWAEHLGINREELTAFLTVTRWKTARSRTLLTEIAQARMAAVGLSPSEEGITGGIDIMRQLVTDDRGPVTPTDIRTMARSLQQSTHKPDGVVVVEAIDTDPAGSDTEYHIDWRRHYPEHTVDAHITPDGGNATYAAMWNDLTELRDVLQNDSIRRILLRGTLRLAGWFAAGRALRNVDGFELTVQRGATLVDSTTPRSSLKLEAVPHPISPHGHEIAVALAISLDPTASIQTYLDHSALPISDLYVAKPVAASGPNVLQSDSDAIASVFDARDHIRRLAAGTQRV